MNQRCIQSLLIFVLERALKICSVFTHCILHVCQAGGHCTVSVFGASCWSGLVRGLLVNPDAALLTVHGYTFVCMCLCALSRSFGHFACLHIVWSLFSLNLELSNIFYFYLFTSLCNHSSNFTCSHNRHWKYGQENY